MSGTREYYEDLFAHVGTWPSHWPSAVRWATGVIPDPPLIENKRDRSLLVLVTEGEFLAGGQDLTDGGSEPFQAYLPAYYLGLHPVTNAQYARFLCKRRPSSGLLEKWIEFDSHCFVYRTADGFEANGGKENHPVVHVSWDGAMAYCTWAGLRLPTELEWEKGARGVDGRKYPWGDQWDASKRRDFEVRDNETTCSVWAYPEVASSWGLYQMSGNVLEWCADEYERGYYSRLRANGGDIARTGLPEGHTRVLRGSRSYSFECTRRYEEYSAYCGSHNGFRCAKSA